MKLFLEYFEKYFGKELTFAIVFVMLGFTSYSFVNKNFLTTEAWADEKVAMVQLIGASADVNELKILMMERRGIVSERTDLILQLENNPNSRFLNSQLNSTDQSLKELDNDIQTIQERLK